MMLVVALAAGGVFDLRLWWLLVPPPVVAGWLRSQRSTAAGRSGWPRQSAPSAVATSGRRGVVAGGTGADLGAAFGAGTQRLLSTEWPSPDRPDLRRHDCRPVSASQRHWRAELARRRRLHLSPLLPVIIAQLLVTALSSPVGVRLRWVLPPPCSQSCSRRSDPDTGVDLRERLTLLRGERRLLPVALIALGVAASLTVPLTISERADPRRTEAATGSAAILDPIEATLALQAIDPPIDLHEIRITDTADEASDRLTSATGARRHSRSTTVADGHPISFFVRSDDA